MINNFLDASLRWHDRSEELSLALDGGYSLATMTNERVFAGMTLALIPSHPEQSEGSNIKKILRCAQNDMFPNPIFVFPIFPRYNRAALAPRKILK